MWLWQGGVLFSVTGFILVLVPLVPTRMAGVVLLSLGLTVVALGVVAHVICNQAYWAPRRREEQQLLAQLAGKQEDSKQVRITTLSELETEEGMIKTTVRKAVRKRLARDQGLL